MGKRLIVIGGGASGFFCAVNAKRMNPDLEVTILEKTNKILSKVRISGGGRCNVTHNESDISLMSRKYPRGQNLVKKTFHHFFTSDTIAWFRERGVLIKAEQDGRMFPVTDNSETIIDCLVREMNLQKVRLSMNSDVKGISRRGDEWVISLPDTEIRADFVCVACGGYPKTSGFRWLLETGHHVAEPVPSLFTFNIPGDPVTNLMGVSVAGAQVKIAGTKLVEKGPVLITHWGLSGPAVLRLSAWGARVLSEKEYRFSALVNWIPLYNEQSARDKMQEFRALTPGSKIFGKNELARELPARLWEHLVERAGIGKDERWGDMSSAHQNSLARLLCGQEFQVSGKTTYKEEFVTAGGIELNEVDANTMESKLLPGLFFAGEILNVDGITGGFNFQHAWTSGYLAATAIAAR